MISRSDIPEMLDGSHGNGFIWYDICAQHKLSTKPSGNNQSKYRTA
jgi:hypothetical protein